MLLSHILFRWYISTALGCTDTGVAMLNNTIRCLLLIDMSAKSSITTFS
jgi:hypothetical protein